ncbi:MAG: HlyD family efflux transporter periplasmic adaptor subunit [Sphingomonadales bacterium]|nr:MAG: HlyD family efflux transporter periplasmic adaptor subunit [Sphingomonadales bacterium]TNF06274.1 MAG: HlyD family efflux transporter periplasmic adaptor subunit [Sphingomonadales bacterium]
MNRRTLILLIATGLLLIIAVLTRGFGLLDGRNGEDLALYGNVDIREVDMAFRVSGRIATMPVEEGAKVSKGTLLATLDPAPIADKVAAADAAVARAQAALDKALDGSRKQEVEQARQKVAAATALRKKAAEDYARRQPLVDSGAISRAAWDGTKAQFDAANAQLAEAQAVLSLAEEGARKEDISAARAALAQAKAERASAGTSLSDTKLHAAADGTITTRTMEPGAMTAAGQTVMTIAIARPMRVRAYVTEPDLGRVSPGMKVIVKADGITKSYHGTIGYISPRAEFTPKSVETESLRTDLVYRLRIIVDDPDDALRQGQPVTITVPDARPAGN